MLFSWLDLIPHHIRNLTKGTVFLPIRLGPPSHTWRYCGALFWYEERVNTSLSAHFFDNIRSYNSMFAFTSMGVHVIDSINDGHGPYVFKISGQLCHRIGSLLPRDGERPEYAQLYIFDTENEIRNRIGVGSYRNKKFRPNPDIVAALIDMFNTHNPIVQLFSAPVASEVVGLVVGDVGQSDGCHDLIVEDCSGQLQRVEEKHYKFMAMQYLILFPYGEDGYHEKIAYRKCRRSGAIKRRNVTMVEHFSYRMHDRLDDFNTPMRCKRGTQTYLVDAYCVEESRLSHHRTKSFQQKYRTTSFREIRDNVSRGITEASEARQKAILPSSYIGGP
ncbi:hypothetical protein BS78_06G062700 [Paspalum vaginatum]|nr:hypothetical protein BS78_06G062700 [Paspalum vaginatum]